MPDEKKCKYCAMMIPKEAKICPHCRKNIGSGSNLWVILILLLLIFWLAGKCSIPSFNSYRETAKKAATAPTPEVTLTDKGKIVKKAHPTWENSDCNTIADNKIRVGMTTDQVETAWGKPYKINTTITGTSQSDQWVMNKNGDTYIYFDNGILTSIQQSK